MKFAKVLTVIATMAVGQLGHVWAAGGSMSRDVGEPPEGSDNDGGGKMPPGDVPRNNNRRSSRRCHRDEDDDNDEDVTGGTRGNQDYQLL